MAVIKNSTAIRKRQQIAGANRTMFVWVAGASALLGIALVLSFLLVQKLVFNEKVLAEKAKTASTLQKNNAVVEDLKSQIRVLNTSQPLIDSKAHDSDQPVQAILDALPSEANSSALGASLQKKLIPGDGITLESFTMDPIAGVESDDSVAASSSDDTATEANQITFRFSVSTTDSNALKALLVRLERSIRVIDVTKLTLETQTNNKLVMSVEARSFYEPAKSVELQDKVVKP